jgi:hypothetical protein
LVILLQGWGEQAPPGPINVKIPSIIPPEDLITVMNNETKKLRTDMTTSQMTYLTCRSPIPASRSASESPEAEGGAPPSPLPAEDEEEGSPKPPSAGGRKRTRSRWQVHFPWRFVSPQALNASGDQIVYRVDDDRDRKWAWRLERAVDHHSAVRERDLDKLSDMQATEVKELTDGSLLRWRQDDARRPAAATRTRPAPGRVTHETQCNSIYACYARLRKIRMQPGLRM